MSHILPWSRMKKNRLMIYFILVVNICVYLVYWLLPLSWQSRVWTKGLLPHQIVYSQSIYWKLGSVREQMGVFHNNSLNYGKPSLIAHTGAVCDFSYMTSLEAVEDALRKGFRYVELDLYETVDGHLVAMHTLEELAAYVGKTVKEVKKMPLQELKKLRIAGKYTVLSDRDVCRLMDTYPEMILVTDRIQDMEVLKDKIFYPDRMIVEVGSRYQYARALELGFNYPALTINSKWNLKWASFDGIPLLVLNAQLYSDPEVKEITQKLHEKRVTILVHNASICDKPNFIQSFVGKNCSMIYTNSWTPANPPPLKRTEEQ